MSQNRHETVACWMQAHLGAGVEDVMGQGAKLLKRVIAVLLLAASCAGQAQSEPGHSGHIPLEQRLTPEQLREIDLTPQQLQLLNQYLGEAERKSRAAAEANEQPAKGPPVETARYETAQGEPRRDPTAMAGFSDQPIKTRLDGSITGWEPGTVFKLQNGQQWKVLKGEMQLREPYDGTEVLVVPGIAGRWFLQVDEDLPKARVYRID